MSETSHKSNKILSNSINWLLYSDIMVKSGSNNGALYGWKNFNPDSFPFIYSEITGYGITSFLWIYSAFSNAYALQAAKNCSKWLIKNMRSYLLVARPAGPVKSDEVSNLYYSFDNGIILIGLLNLYKTSKDAKLLEIAERMAEKIITLFFDGSKLTARLDEEHNPITDSTEDGLVKWSTIPGSYHSKLSIGLLELSRLTKNKLFKRVSDSVCDYAISLQKSNGQFITNRDSDITYLHPHLYSCEGLIYSGLSQNAHNHYSAGLKGLIWAMDQIYNSKNGGLVSNTGRDSSEQSDCSAQLLRLLILCRSELQKYIEVSKLDRVINRLHLRLLDFYIPTDKDRGAMRYRINLDSACSWCTMFAMQALALSNIRNSDLKWIDYFV